MQEDGIEKKETRIGAKRAKAEKTKLILQARHVKASELITKNGASRVAIAKEHLEMEMFLNAPNDDEDAREYLRLKRKQALMRLKAELNIPTTEKPYSALPEADDEASTNQIVDEGAVSQ